MGGDIGLNSELGHGSEFWFRLNLQMQPEQSDIKTCLDDLRGTRVLVADKNPAIRELIKEQLIHWGMRIDEAADGAALLNGLRRGFEDGDPYRAALLDMELSGMDVEAFRAMHSDLKTKETSIVLMRSLKSIQQEHKFKELDATLFLMKPIRQVELLRIIRKSCAPKENIDKNGKPQFETLAKPVVRPKGKVLLVEDNNTNQVVAVALLKKLGFEADIASNGEEALHAVSRAQYDIVLMDVQMPFMDGLEATRRIRNIGKGKNDEKLDTAIVLTDAIRVQCRTIPIIAMTAHAMDRDRDECLSAGMNDFVSKPIKSQLLSSVLDRWCSVITDTTTDPSTLVLPKNISSPSNIPTESEIIFDRQALLDRMMGDQEIIVTLKEVFLSDMPMLIEKLKRHIENGETKSAGELVHRIRGAAANIGGVAMSNHADLMETTAKQGDHASLVNQMPELLSRFERLKTALMESRT